nr:site-specific integrase [uncultured Oscillibacter sp.]
MASIKKLDTRKFKITVSNGYRPDGRKISRARTITVPQSVGGRGIPQYVAHEAEEFEKQIKSGYSEGGEMTFQEYATRWLGRQTKYAPGTLGFYRRSLEAMYPMIGNIKLNRLRPIALENLLVELRKRTWRGRPIQESTVQKYLTAVSAVLSDAKRNEIIEKNPARMIDLPETTPRLQIIPTDEEAHRFLDILANEEDPYKTFYALAIYTGCRRGELCALKWQDIIMNGDESILTVSRSRSSVPGQGVIEGTTKNGQVRIIYLGEDMTGILRSYCYQKMCEAQEGGFEMGDYVFTNEDGKLMHPDTFSRHLRRIYDRNNFPREFHLHTLRHYFVSTMLHNGVDKQTVAELAGHGDTGFLERTYCHPQLQLKREAARIHAQTVFDFSNRGSESA